MVNSVKDSKSTVCTNCGKAITSLSKNTSPITVTREEEYQKQIESGFGMYCPNCDHFLCLSCLPTIGAKSRKKLFSGLFSRKKPENEMSLKDLPIDNAIRNKLEEKLRVKGTRIVVMKCMVCGAYFGKFPEDKKRFVEEFVKKIIENRDDDITISEASTFINDVQVLISRLEKYNLINESTEQLRKSLELTINNIGLPKLKQLITQHIENKEYDEARELCDKGTLWNGYLKDKGSWEHDLQSIDTLIKASKSISSKKKYIDTPPKTFYIKTTTWHEETEANQLKTEKSYLKSIIVIWANIFGEEVEEIDSEYVTVRLKGIMGDNKFATMTNGGTNIYVVFDEKVNVDPLSFIKALNLNGKKLKTIGPKDFAMMDATVQTSNMHDGVVTVESIHNFFKTQIGDANVRHVHYVLPENLENQIDSLHNKHDAVTYDLIDTALDSLEIRWIDPYLYGGVWRIIFGSNQEPNASEEEKFTTSLINSLWVKEYPLSAKINEKGSSIACNEFIFGHNEAIINISSEDYANSLRKVRRAVS